MAISNDFDIANIALRRIGATPITAIDDNSTNGKIVNDLYDDVRDELLRSHPWNFATKRQELTRQDNPAFEFDHDYPLPSDWLRTISVHGNDAGHGTILYRMEIVNGERAIVTSADEVWLRYVFQNTDVTEWPPDFQMAVAYALARDLAIPIASSNTLHNTMATLAARQLAKARSTDALGAFPELRPRGSWADARGGFRNDDFLSD